MSRRAIQIGRQPAGLYLLLVSLAAVALFSSHFGSYVQDFRYAVVENPGKTFGIVLHAQDTEGGLGFPISVKRGFITSSLYFIPRSLGASVWLTQRIVLVFLVSLAGIGAHRFTKAAVPSMTMVGQGLSALVYCFGPVALGLLRPSAIFMIHVALPWMLTAVLAGPSSKHRKCWAAVLAISVVAMAEHEIPGFMYSFVFAGIVLVYQLWSSTPAERKAIVRWLSTAIPLTILTSSYLIIRTALSISELTTRLALTEDVTAPAVASSFSEVIRGAGHWLNYFRLGVNTRPHLDVLAENPVVVIATFVVSGAAIIGLVAFRPTNRGLLGFMVVAGTIASVGIHPAGDSTPYGEILNWLFERFEGSQALRATSKAGPGLALGTAVLFGVFVSGAANLLARHFRPVFYAFAALTIALASFPMWTANAFPAHEAQSDIPDYWYEATDFLNGLDADSTVLSLPGAEHIEFEWGSVGDDLISALVDVDWIYSPGLLTSAAGTNDVIAGIDQSITDVSRRFSSLAPVLRKVGIDYVVVRNDIDAEATSVPGAAAFEYLKEDDGFSSVASFGADSFGPKVEIFRVDSDAQDHPIVPISSGQPILILGDGESLGGLATHGELDGENPFYFAAELTNAELLAYLESDAVVVVSDTNAARRRASTRARVLSSEPLASSTDDATAFFDVPGAITEPTFGVAANISTNADNLGKPFFRPGQAFDAAGDTAWGIPFLHSGPATIDIEFHDPQIFGSLMIEPPAGTALRAGELVADENVIATWPVGPNVDLEFEEVSASEVTIRFLENESDGPVLQVVNIQLDDLDLRPGLALPTAHISWGQESAEIADALADVPLVFSFERLASIGSPRIEAEVVREFVVDSARTFRITGWLAGFFEADDDFDACRNLISVDDEPIGIRASGPIDPETGIVPFESCETLTLAPGEHTFDHLAAITIETALVYDIRLDIEAEAPAVSAHIVEQNQDVVELQAFVERGPVLVSSGVAMQPGWEASIDGDSVPVLNVNSLAAVEVPTGDHVVRFYYGPQRIYRVGVLLTFLGFALCFVLIGVSWSRTLTNGQFSSKAQDPPNLGAVATSRGDQIAFAVLAAAVGFLVGGLVAAAIALASFVWLALHPKVAAGVVSALLAAAAAATLLEAPLVSDLWFALNRPVAAGFAQVLVAVVTGSAIRFVLDDKGRGGSS